jgi:hypothetical protein
MAAKPVFCPEAGIGRLMSVISAGKAVAIFLIVERYGSGNSSSRIPWQG